MFKFILLHRASSMKSSRAIRRVKTESASVSETRSASIIPSWRKQRHSPKCQILTLFSQGFKSKSLYNWQSVDRSWRQAPSLGSWQYFKFWVLQSPSSWSVLIDVRTDPSIIRCLPLVNRTTHSWSPEKILLHSVAVKVSYSVTDRVANGDTVELG